MNGFFASFGQTSAKQRYVQLLAVILLAAFALRVGVRAATGTEEFWRDSYYFFFESAQSLVAGHGYATTNGVADTSRVPFYAIFVAVFTQGQMRFWPLLIAQAAISTGTVACAAALAHMLFGRRAAIVAAALTAFYPYYFRHDTALQESGLFTFLVAGATLLLLHAQRSRSVLAAAGAGIMLGLAVLTRSMGAPFALAAAAWLLISAEAGTSRMPRLRNALLYLALLGVTLSPWLVRQHATTGRWTLGTNFGAYLYDGNNPWTFAVYPEGSIDASRALEYQALSQSDRAELSKLDDVGVSDWFQRKGLDYIRAHPGPFVVNAVRKNIAAFGVLPSPRHGFAVDLIAVVTYGPILVLGLLGLWQDRRRWRTDSLIYLQFLTFAAVTGLVWGHSSHRAFLDVYLIVFAAGWLVRQRWLVDRIAGKWRARKPDSGLPPSPVQLSVG